MIADKIISKIQKLLARGDEARNDNEHEREVAMRQAHAMLAMHGLEMSDVTEAVDQRDHLGAVVKGECGLSSKYVWERGIWGQIARLNGCRAISNPRKHAIYLIGRQARCDVVKLMARYVVDSVRREAKINAYSIASFGNGAWSGVARQVDDILKAMAQGEIGAEKVSTGTALILVDQHKTALVEADAAVKVEFPKLTKGRGSQSRDGDSYHAGKAYGESVGLNQPISGGARARLAA